MKTFMLMQCLIVIRQCSAAETTDAELFVTVSKNEDIALEILLSVLIDRAQSFPRKILPNSAG